MTNTEENKGKISKNVGKGASSKTNKTVIPVVAGLSNCQCDI